MSAATIDRLLAPFKLSMYPEGKSTTRSRRNQYTEAIPIMSRIPDSDWQPGLVAIDTVAHCGNSAKGQYAFTLTATDVFTGWTVNRAIKNKASKWVVKAMDEIQDEFPYPIDHIHSDYAEEIVKPSVRLAPRHSGEHEQIPRLNV